jgi:tetratricopeptide (TPR) repeat protein
MAANCLMWIYVKNKRPLDGLEVADWLEKRYPRSRLVLWGQAYGNLLAGRYTESIECFGRLIEQLTPLETNYFNLIECRYHRAVMFRALRRREQAIAELEKLLAYPAVETVRERQEDKLSRAEAMHADLKESAE